MLVPDLVRSLASTLPGMPVLSPRELLADLPQKVGRSFHYVPAFMQKSALGFALGELFGETLKAGELDYLKGRWLKIVVDDISMSLLFSCGPGRETLVSVEGEGDVVIRGNLAAFLELAAKKEDADTLFFKRRLVIEGDTDLGLEIKNMLDQIALDRLSPEVRFLISAAADYTSAFKRS